MSRSLSQGSKSSNYSVNARSTLTVHVTALRRVLNKFVIENLQIAGFNSLDDNLLRA